MPKYSIIYPDSNCLIKEGWPDPSTALGNLLSISSELKVRFVLLDSVEKELEAHYMREFEEKVGEANAKVDRLGRVVRNVSLDVRIHTPTANEVRESYRGLVNHLVKGLRMERATVKPRDTAELFDMAIRHEKPFGKKGCGFQDAVICLAAVDHLAASGEKVGALITRDGALEERTLQILASQKETSLLLYASVDAIFKPALEEYLEQRARAKVAAIRADEAQAKEVIEKDIPRIERFISDNLEIPEYVFGDRILEVRAIKVLGVRDVRTPLEEAKDGTASISADFDVEIRVVAEPGIFRRMGPQKKIKLSGAVEPEENAFLAWRTEPSEEVMTRTVSVEFRVTRTGGAYGGIEPLSIEMK